jgi:hypothetical protein
VRAKGSADMGNRRELAAAAPCMSDGAAKTCSFVAAEVVNENCLGKKLYKNCLMLILRLDTAMRVGDLDIELTSALNDGNALGRRNGVGDLGGIDAVVHEQKVDVLNVKHAEPTETVGQQTASPLVAAKANTRLGRQATVAATQTRINTARLAPRRADAHETVRLVALEVLCALLHNLGLSQRLHSGRHFLFFFCVPKLHAKQDERTKERIQR